MEIYSAATKRDQARLVFDEAQRMVNSSPELKQVIKVHKHSLFQLARRMWFFHFFGEPQNKQFESAGVRFDASSQTLLKSKTFASLKVQMTAQRKQ
jgi:hypothetical protein